MLANISELRTDVRSLINETTPAFWTNDEIDRWLNEGQEEVGTRIRALASHYTREIEADDIFHERELRLNVDFIVMAEGGVFYNGKPLAWTSLRALTEWTGDWKEREGEPQVFYLRSDAIGFVPKPKVGDTVEYYGIERPLALSGDTVTLNGDYRLIAYRRAIRDYAIARCWEKKNETIKADRKLAEFEMKMFGAQSIIHSHQMEGAHMIPAYRSRGVAYGIRYGHTGNPIG